METEVLYDFESHVSGKNARVRLYRDRIEWELKRGLSGAKLVTGIATVGLSLAATGVRNGKAGTQMIPVRTISSITTKRDGFRNTLVSVITAGNTIDFRVSHDEAKQVVDLLNRSMLGS